MTAQLVPLPIFKGWDNNGNPLAGGKLFTYVAGTSTPQATWTDISQAQQNTNPIILNARGEANIWLDINLDYKLVLADSQGNTIWTIDNVADTAGGTVFNADVFTTFAGQTTFTLSTSPGSSNSITASLDGAVLIALDDFTLTGTTFTLNVPAMAGQRLRVGYTANLGSLIIPNGSVTDASLAVGSVIGAVDATYFRTPGEIAAGVVPTNFGYPALPIADVRRYGWASGNSAAVNATALQNAISSIGAIAGGNGGTVQLPPGSYPMNPVTLPAGVAVRGSGKRATYLTWAPAGVSTLFTLGGAASNYYGCAVSDFTVQLTGTVGTIILCQQTVGAEVSRLYLEGETIVNGRATQGVVIDAGSASAAGYFNNVTDVECNHLNQGFVETTSGSTQSTQNLFRNCNMGSGDNGVDLSSQGFTVGANCGQGSVYVGTDTESCIIGMRFTSTARPATVIGGRFEGNTTDIQFDANASGQSLIGCVFGDPIVDNTGDFRNQYVSCWNGSHQNIVNKQTQAQFGASGTGELPIKVIAAPSQTSDLVQIQNSAATPIAGMDGNGQVRGQTLKATAATTHGAASTVTFGITTTTSATAGSNGAVPAQVAGYLEIDIGGTFFKLPYFNV